MITEDVTPEVARLEITVKNLEIMNDACITQRNEFQARVNRLEQEVREWVSSAGKEYGIDSAPLRDLMTRCGIDAVVQRSFTITATFSGTLEVSVLDQDGIDFEDVLDINLDPYNAVGSINDKVDVVHSYVEVDDVTVEDE